MVVTIRKARNEFKPLIVNITLKSEEELTELMCRIALGLRGAHPDNMLDRLWGELREQLNLYKQWNNNMFESKKELALALLEGRKFKTRGGFPIYYDEKHRSSPFRVKIDNEIDVDLKGLWDSYNTVREVVKQTDGVNRGHLCPFKMEMNGDYVTLCDCNERDTAKCAEDI